MKTTIDPIPGYYWDKHKPIKTEFMSSSVGIQCVCGETLYTDHEDELERCECGRVYRVILRIDIYEPVKPCPVCGYEQMDLYGCRNIECSNFGG